MRIHIIVGQKTVRSQAASLAAELKRRGHEVTPEITSAGDWKYDQSSLPKLEGQEKHNLNIKNIAAADAVILAAGCQHFPPAVYKEIGAAEATGRPKMVFAYGAIAALLAKEFSPVNTWQVVTKPSDEFLDNILMIAAPAAEARARASKPFMFYHDRKLLLRMLYQLGDHHNEVKEHGDFVSPLVYVQQGMQQELTEAAAAFVVKWKGDIG